MDAARGRERIKARVNRSERVLVTKDEDVQWAAVLSIDLLGLLCENWIIVSELKSFGEQHGICSLTFFFDLFALLFRDVKHRIVKKISHALLNLSRLAPAIC